MEWWCGEMSTLTDAERGSCKVYQMRSENSLGWGMGGGRVLDDVTPIKFWYLNVCDPSADFIIHEVIEVHKTVSL